MAARQSPEERRQAILDAAVRVFALHGFAAATTDDIARSAGLSKGGLYWHFKSKDDILAALLEQMFNQELAALEQLAGAPGSAAARLRLLGAQMAEALLALEQALPVVLEFYALAARQSAVREWLQAYFQRYQRLLAGLLKQGYASGEFRHGAPEQSAVLLIAQLEGLALVWAVAPGQISLREQVAEAVELTLRGLAQS